MPRTRQRNNPLFMRPLRPSKHLAAIVADGVFPRTEIVKRVWEYLREHDLQDRDNRRVINADGKLLPIFGYKKQVSLFDLTRFLSQHLEAASPEEERAYEAAEDRRGLARAYTLLQCKPDVSDEELRSVYHQLCRQYHPDRVSSLGPELVELATDKFQDLQWAYDFILQDRGGT